MAVHYQASARCFFSIGGAARDGVFRHHQDEQLGRMARGRRLDGVAFHGEQGAVVGRQDQRSCLRRARWLSPPPLSQALFSSVGRSAFMAALSMLGRGVRGAGPPEPVCRALLLSSLDVVSFDTTKTNSSSYFSRPCDGSMLLDMASDPHAKLFGCAEPRRREGRDGLGAGG